MLLYSSSIFLSFSIACTLIYVLVMNFIRNGMFKTFAHCMRSTHTYTADATKIFLFDFVIVLLLLFCRCVRSLFFEHIYHFSVAI